MSDNMATDAKRKEQARMGKDNAESIAVMVILGILGVITAVAVFFDSDIFGPGSVFDSDPTGNRIINDIYHYIPAMIRTCEILFVTLFFFVLLSVVKKRIKSDTHFQTALKLIISFTRYALFVVAIIWILSSWGVDTRTLLVSAGILGLIIGLGAQSLIADIIAGMFIVFDGEFKVGDIIVVDGWRGNVMEIGIRTTKFIDEGGNIKYINNSTINAVVNQSQELSVIKSELSIFYDENLESVELRIKEYLPKIKDKIPYIVEGPYYKGVNSMNDSSVSLLFLAKCDEHYFYQARRALNREIYRMANEMNIPIPYNQIVINQPLPDGTFAESTTTPSEKKAATNFAYDQAVSSMGMEAENDSRSGTNSYHSGRGRVTPRWLSSAGTRASSLPGRASPVDPQGLRRSAREGRVRYRNPIPRFWVLS